MLQSLLLSQSNSSTTASNPNPMHSKRGPSSDHHPHPHSHDDPSSSALLKRHRSLDSSVPASLPLNADINDDDLDPSSSSSAASSSSLGAAGAVDIESTGLRLLGLLLQCAECVAMDNLDEASNLLPEIAELSSPFGSSAERVATYFADALSARIVSSYLGTYAPLNIKSLDL